MAKPRLVYDDDCGFCTWCAAVGRRFGDVEAVGFASLSPDQKARLPEGWRNSAHLLTDDAVYSGGAAIQGVLIRMLPALAGVFGLFERVPGYDRLRERLYRWGADHRDWWGKIVSRDSL
ncbi:thiol-disulfide oxidoreductase DCC family protein [Halolamina sp. C58]|uniref:thiol-disulfide oxidoreductase DCC family protein n=1 Tax=Halolamina sp. C58 TaxID=3421640 RepID=UPI003EB7981E